MQAQTPSLVFLVAAYIYKQWWTSFVQAKTVEKHFVAIMM